MFDLSAVRAMFLKCNIQNVLEAPYTSVMPIRYVQQVLHSMHDAASESLAASHTCLTRVCTRCQQRSPPPSVRQHRLTDCQSAELQSHFMIIQRSPHPTQYYLFTMVAEAKLRADTCAAAARHLEGS
jgi:hypothetical protein